MKRRPWTDYQYRQAKFAEEYAYRRGYDQAMFNVLQILEKFGTDMGAQRVKRLKVEVKRWRSRIMKRPLRKEIPPGDRCYGLEAPKRVKDREFIGETLQIVECGECERSQSLLDQVFKLRGKRLDDYLAKL